MPWEECPSFLLLVNSVPQIGEAVVWRLGPEGIMWKISVPGSSSEFP